MTETNKPDAGAHGGDALLVVDLQRDFLPGGALAVPGGDQVVPPLQRCLALFAERGRPIFMTRDWHPADHCSFEASGGPWPAHCVAGTPGADFPQALRIPGGTHVVSKGTDPRVEAYSAFSDPDLCERLRRLGIRRLTVGGLATDYCVLQTVLDALSCGFDVRVMTDAVAAVDVEPGDGARALQRMQSAGAGLTTSARVLSSS